MHPAELTPADATLIAAELGWEYLPASDEGLRAIEAYPPPLQSLPCPPAPSPLVSLGKARRRAQRIAIRSAQEQMRSPGYVDDQLVEMAMGADPVVAAYLARPGLDREGLVLGLVRFAERAAGVRD